LQSDSRFKLTTCKNDASLRMEVPRESFFCIFDYCCCAFLITQSLTMKTTNIARFFVAIQLSSLVYLLLSAPMIADSVHGILIEVAGLFLGVVAILQMKIGNFNIVPIPKKGGVLVTHGIYELIRHPMYLAQLMAMAALVADYYSLLRLLVLLLLLFDLVIKLHYEESLLVKYFEGYREYMQRSWRLIPYIY